MPEIAEEVKVEEIQSTSENVGNTAEAAQPTTENTNITVVEATFTKEQIIKAKKYRDKRDLINALLVNGRSYELAEVDKMIEKFMEEGVK